ncbi:MAG: sulfotransferase [Psychrosphaera sp.]|nr:sulfotransferase [Psychrosphaera sp.]
MQMNVKDDLLDSLLDKAWHFINLQKVEQAVAACKQLNQHYPNSADGWFASSFLAFQLRNAQQALVMIDKAVALEPQNARWQLHKAHTLLIFGDKAAALTIATALTDKNYTDVDFCAELALVLNKLSSFALAARYYQQAIDLAAGLPSNRESENAQTLGQLYFNLGSIQRYLGDIEAAGHSLDKAIELNPTDDEAYLLRSSLVRQTEQSNHITALENRLKQPIKNPLAKAQLYYALAKENEDLQRYTHSFAALSAGAAARRQNMRYEVNSDLSTIDKIIDVYDQSAFNESTVGHSSAAAKSSAAPIFILGLPRTGSTLVERIVSQHSEVLSAGELNHFAVEMMAQVKNIAIQAKSQGQDKEQGPDAKQALVTQTRQLDFAQLGQDYLEKAQSETAPSAHFIDKLPLNSLYAGLIHLALPQAKIIYVKRHPLAACYAIYKQLFTNGYPFSYDLKELASYYIAHHKLMNHWRKVMPGVIYDVAYEDIVANVDIQAKGLISYCGLEWQAQCSAFEQNTAPSTTASATQVRQGIYKGSIHQWRNYESQLATVKTMLEQAGIDCS